MKKIHITFGGNVYDTVTKKIYDRSTLLGSDELWVYDDLWLSKNDFYFQNKWLWEHPHKRGFGWYAWKPFIIIDALSKLSDGDIVLYTDADTYPISNFSILYDICNKEGMMAFEVTGEKNRSWCKRDCYITMNQDNEKYYDAQAAVARFILFKKGDWKSTQLLYEWLTYCLNQKANTFDKSVLGKELDGFIEHRAEQAILTLLIHKYNYPLYREACGLGEVSNKNRDLYRQLFVQENPWNDSNNGRAMTAPLLGSKFQNVSKKETPNNSNTNSHYISSAKRNSLLNLIDKIIILSEKYFIIIKKFISKALPVSIKTIIKKYIK